MYRERDIVVSTFICNCLSMLILVSCVVADAGGPLHQRPGVRAGRHGEVLQDAEEPLCYCYLSILVL